MTPAASSVDFSTISAPERLAAIDSDAAMVLSSWMVDALALARCSTGWAASFRPSRMAAFISLSELRRKNSRSSRPFTWIDMPRYAVLALIAALSSESARRGSPRAAA